MKDFSAPKSLFTARISFTGCVLRLSRSNFSDCSALAKEVSRLTRFLLGGDVVTKGGDPDYEDEEEFVSIIRQDEEEEKEAAAETLRSAVAEELAAETTEELLLPDEEEINPLEKLFPSCPVPSSVVVKVLYTR